MKRFEGATTAATAALLVMLVCGGGGLRAADDLVFANGFDDEAPGQDPPPLCEPEAPLYPIFDIMGLPLTLRAVFSPNEIGAQLSQVKLEGGSWEAYRFTRPDLPADLVEFNADTSNVGPGAVGADVRYVVIAECAGDFRDPVQSACSAFVNEGAFLYLNFGAPRAGVCNLDPARAYYFNVHVGPQPCNSFRFSNTCAFRISVLPRD